MAENGQPAAANANTNFATEIFAYRYYVLAILFVVYAVNYIDRVVLAILLQDIKLEFGLSDTQLGLLASVPFAIFYSVMGLPVARLADKWNRKKIIALSLGAWSALTALCGLTQNFIQLLFARILVGIGEAGGNPPSHALISEYFKSHERSRAISIYTVGGTIGLMIGFALGGLLNDMLGWRMTLIALGVPGVLLALVVWFTLREPPRTHGVEGSADVTKSTVRYLFAYLMKKRSFLYIAIAASLMNAAASAVTQWVPSFLVRSFDMSSSEAGTWLSLAFGIGGIVGLAVGGFCTDYAVKKSNARWYALVPAVAGIGSTAAYFAFYYSPGTGPSFPALLTAILLGAMHIGPTFAVAQNLSPPEHRALTASILLLAVNLIGGLAPQVVGIVSDVMSANYGTESLRYALLYVGPACVAIATLCYFLASRHLVEDLADTASAGSSD